jgi:hypothetical protein
VNKSKHILCLGLSGPATRVVIANYNGEPTLFISLPSGEVKEFSLSKLIDEAERVTTDDELSEYLGEIERIGGWIDKRAADTKKESE